MENQGYYLLPKFHPHSPGYTGLLVAIRERPTGMHFDPESIIFGYVTYKASQAGSHWI
jgi:hypothetical protein